MHGRREWAGAVALLLTVLGCGTKSAGDDARGRGHVVTTLPQAAIVRAYAAAVRSAFDPSPDLHLLVAPTYLPRSSGYGAGDSLPRALIAALEAARVIQGECVPIRANARRAPTCTAKSAGYITRFSELFQLGSDSVELYVQAEVYAPGGGSGQQPFAFEMAYQMLRRGESWRVIREGRVRQSDGSH